VPLSGKPTAAAAALVGTLFWVTVVLANVVNTAVIDGVAVDLVVVFEFVIEVPVLIVVIRVVSVCVSVIVVEICVAVVVETVADEVIAV
jgi:hypothetical protein